MTTFIRSKLKDSSVLKAEGRVQARNKVSEKYRSHLPYGL